MSCPWLSTFPNVITNDTDYQAGTHAVISCEFGYKFNENILMHIEDNLKENDINLYQTESTHLKISTECMKNGVWSKDVTETVCQRKNIIQLYRIIY